MDGKKMDGTHHIMRYVYDAVYRPCFRVIPPFTVKVLLLLRNI